MAAVRDHSRQRNNISSFVQADAPDQANVMTWDRDVPPAISVQVEA